MEIEITYQVYGDESPRSVFLTPEQYLDPLEPGETYEEDGVAKYGHAWQYLGIPLDRLVWTVLRRAGMADGSVHRTDFFRGGRSWILHRNDSDGYEELIHETELEDGSFHIIRSHRTDGRPWAMNTNVVIRNNGTPLEHEESYL
jgi:hypothetical protein